MEQNQYKRNVAYKLRIGSILAGKPIIENERLKHIEIENKEVIRINLIANITDKIEQDGEKKYSFLTLDDATGQISLKAFGEDIEKVKDLSQGDTIMVIGLLRSWNNDVYITPEIIKKKDPSYLLVRKLEIERDAPKIQDPERSAELKDKILTMVKDAEKEEGIFIDKIIMNLKETPEVINTEIKKLLENGSIYEPRPGKIRYLG